MKPHRIPRAKAFLWSRAFPVGLIALASLSLCVVAAQADTTTATIAPGSVTITGPNPATLAFPITRSGDAAYDLWVGFKAVDGTAKAGTDYVGGNGVFLLPANAATAAFPIEALGASAPSADKQFTLDLTGAVGVGPLPSFGAKQTFGVGNDADKVIAADVNGDGKPDLIVTNVDDNNVSVLLNTTVPGAATPSFATQQTFGVGNHPNSVTAADVNGDGRPDLLVANASDNDVSVLLNTTTPGAMTPSFAAQRTFGASAYPNSVAAADVNGDGRPDLIVANFHSNDVSVLLNATAPGAATPVFAPQQTFGVGNRPSSVTAADVNGDGKPDLIAANRGDKTVSVLLNSTKPGATMPSFGAQQTFGVGDNPVSVTTANVNGDGRPDLIVANSDSHDVSVLLDTTAPGAVAPSFATQQTVGAGTPLSVAAADVNGDGKPDLIITDLRSDDLSVVLNITMPGAATPSFASEQTFDAGPNQSSVAVADVNADGKPDLIAVNTLSSSVSVLLNTTPAPAAAIDFAAHTDFSTAGSFPEMVAAADVNGDGKPDLVVPNAGEANVAVLLNATAPGAATPSFAAGVDFPTTPILPRSVAILDVNGDGRPDVAVAHGSVPGKLTVYLNATAPGAAVPSFVAPRVFASGGALANSVAAADFNGDGRPDLVADNFRGGIVSVFVNTTAPGAAVPSFASHQDFAIAGEESQRVGVADMNGDGRPDILADYYGSDSRRVSVLVNTTAPGAATLSFAAHQDFNPGGGWITMDVNGDGKPDLVASNYDGDDISVLMNTTAPGSATITFAAAVAVPLGEAPGQLAAADVNGDGKPDLVATRVDGNNVTVLLNATVPGSMTPRFVATQDFATGEDPRAPLIEDVNGDGRPDLLTANYDAGSVSVLLSTQYAATIAPASVTGTIHYAIPTVALSPTALDFGTQAVDSSASQDVTLTNTGNADLALAMIAIFGAAAFSESDDCPNPLVAGDSCTLKVTFEPTAKGSFAATLSVASNAPGSPVSVYLNGTGKAQALGGGAWGAAGLLFLAALAGFAALVRRRQG